MCAAIAARKKVRSRGIADQDFEIVILERNARPGVKIRISGGGKCNVTHQGTLDELLHKGFLRKTEQRFLRHSIYAFSNEDVLDLLRKQGVATVVRDDGKVFPLSGMADDVLKAFERMLVSSGVQVITGEKVKSVENRKNFFTVCTENSEFSAGAVVVATGGVSYSQAGTTGDGLEIARSLGHSVMKPLPALAPMYLKPAPPRSLAGVSLQGVVLKVVFKGKNISRTGDLLITHKGISGPACLSLSRETAELLGDGVDCEARLGFLPTCSSERLTKLLLNHAAENGARFIRKFLQAQASIPSAIIPFIMQQAGVNKEEKWGTLTKKARRSLEHTLQNYVLGVVKAVPLDAAEVSAGGVALKEVNPKTMESRVCRGFFLCGEVLDYAGEIGGFNLQAAFSTGWLAGSSIC